VTLRSYDGVPMTTSQDVAEHFGKQHKHVLRDIETLDCSVEFNRSNFGPATYLDAKGEQRPMVKMTRDGFVFLAMGYTGKRAAAFKEAYIAEFNRFERFAIEQVQRALLEIHPRWKKIAHYQALGLNGMEIARLLRVSKDTVYADKRRMAGCGLRGAQS